MLKKVLAIHGSPRGSGNTDILAERLLQGIRERQEYGFEVEINQVFANKVDVSPCRECSNCSRTGECIVKDEMQDIYVLLLDCDLLVVSSPIFFTTVSGYLKAMIDRCQRFWSLKYEHKKKIVNKERNGILISTAGSNQKDIFDCTKKVIRALFDVLYIDYLADFTFNEVDKKGDILKDRQALEKLYDFGREGALFKDS